MLGTEWIYALTDKITAPLAGVNRALSATDNMAARTENSISHIGQSAKGMGATFTSIAGLAAGAFAGIGLAEIGRSIFEIGTDMEMVNLNYRTLLQGNVGLADKLVGSLKEFGKNTKFSNAEVLNAGQSLLGFGVNAKSVLPVIQTLGDLSLGNSQKFMGLVDNYGKMVSAQRANTMDLNQFAIAGIPIWQELEKITGKSGQALRKSVEQSGVSIETINQIFSNLTSKGGNFFEALKNSSDATVSKLGNILATFEEIGEKIFNKIRPAIHVLFDFGIRVLPTVESGLKGVYDFLLPIVKFLYEYRTAIIAIAAAYTGWQIGLAITTALQSIQYMWMMRSVIAETLLATATSILTIAQQGLNAALMANPIGLVIGLLASFATIMYGLWQSSETFRATLYGLWEAAKVVGTNLFTIFKALGKVILGTFLLDFDMLKSGIADMGRVGEEMGKAYASGQQKGIASFAADKQAGKDTSLTSLVAGGTTTDTTATAGNKTNTTTVSAGAGAGGGNSRTIQVTIQKLGEVNITASGIDDIEKQAYKIRKIIHESLIGGVRDFEVAISNT